MIKQFLLSIKGKITSVIFLIIFLLSGFAVFVFFQSLEVKKRFDILYKHNEPTVTLHFIGVSCINSSIGDLNKAAFLKDTSTKQNFNNNIEAYMNFHKIIKLHCDTLGIKNYDLHKKVLLKNQEYLLTAKELFQIIEKYQINKNGFEQPVDTLLKEQLKKSNEKFWQIFGAYSDYLASYIGNKDIHLAEILALSERLTTIIILISFLIIVIGFLMWKNIYSYISYSISTIVTRLQQMSKGELIEQNVESKDEVGQIMEASNILVGNIKNASLFAKKVGQGDYSYNYNPASDKDELGRSLLYMRNELQNFKIEDEKRFWINKGLAIFADVIRQNGHDKNLLADRFLAQLIEYTDSNQGAIYINEEAPQVTKLEMLACYAYNKKKHFEVSIAIGEGLVGQTYKEKQLNHITEIPEDYIKITSGLGEALPTTLLFLPLMIDENMLGVVELASLNAYPKHKIEFIQKICDNLASVLQTSANATKMKKLVDDLQLKSEQMHAQEEELRQNMEELMATQEETKRAEIALKNENQRLLLENIELKNKLK